MIVRRLFALCVFFVFAVTAVAQDDPLDRAFLLLRQAERVATDVALQKEIRVAYGMIDTLRDPKSGGGAREKLVAILRDLSKTTTEVEPQKAIAEALRLIDVPAAGVTESTASLSGTATANVETANGLHSVHFDTLEGTVTVNLPDDTSAGDSISGTVVAEGKGKTEQEKTANQDSLSGYVVEIDKQDATPKQEWSKWVIPAAAVVAIPVILKDRQGREIARAKVPVKPQAPEQPKDKSAYELPTDAQSGKTAQVTGSFDGDLATTAITAAGRAVRVLAESPRKAILQTPTDTVGKMQLDIRERDTQVKCELRTIGVRLSAPNVNLKTGQSTTMTVTVTGLEELQQPVSLVLANFTPGVVKMSGGEKQSVTITPAEVKGSTYMMTRTLTSVLPGGFNITATASGYGTKRCEVVTMGNATTTPSTGTAGSQPAVGTTLPGSIGNAEVVTRCSLSTPGPDNREDNWDFERTITVGWRADGDAFVNQPVRVGGIAASRIGFGAQRPPTLGGDYWDGPWRNFQIATTPINQHDGAWIGTYDERTSGDGRTGDPIGDGATGTLVSKEFTITHDYVSFLVGGGSSVEDEGIELQIREEDYNALRTRVAGLPDPATLRHDGCWIIWSRAAGRNSETMCRQRWAVNRLRGDAVAGAPLSVRARVRVYDFGTGDWGHINVDDIRFEDSRPEEDACAGPKTPLFGFVDTHAHPMNHLGFGGRFFTGVPGGNWRTTNIATDLPSDVDAGHGGPTVMARAILFGTEPEALADAPGRIAGDPASAVCTALAGPIIGLTGAAAFAGSVLGGEMVGADWMSMLVEQMPIIAATGGPCTGVIVDKVLYHRGGGFPGFDGYPKWYTRAHQQMHITWIRRAYDGGLRVMSALAGNNALMGKFVNGATTAPTPERSIVESEIAFMRRLVDQNSDWMEIALTPQDLRRIVSSNKLAVILGTEIDGNGTIFPDAEDEVQWLFNLGVRQVIPIHLANNPLGGNGIYGDMYNTLTQFLNRTSETDTSAYYNVEEACPDPARSDCVQFRLGETLGPRALRQANREIPFFGNLPFMAIDAVGDRWPVRFNGHRNTLGLTPKGVAYVRALMRRGMLVDVDHMGAKATDATLAEAQAQSYPILSSHAGFRELKWRRSQSSAEGKWPAENHKTREQVRIIGELGGFISPNSAEEEMHDFNGPEGLPGLGDSTTFATVMNDSAGSSKSFAQAFLYALQFARGAGVGVGTDMNGLPGSAAPRFGTDASAHLDGDSIRNPGNSRRRAQALNQGNGVAYDVPLSDYRYPRFRSTSLFHQDERDALEAMAIATSGTDPDRAWQPSSAIERTLIQGEIVKNYARGFRAANESQLERGCINEINSACFEQRAAFLAKRDFEGPRVDISGEPQGVRERYEWLRPLFRHWAAFARSRANRPLQRLRIPTPGFVIPEKDFDLNIDGFANYGLFPDFMQDLKNVGLPDGAMTKMFNGAEDYARMWERACEASVRMGGTSCRP